MDTIHVVIDSPKVASRIEARVTPALEPPGVVARDLARYYALLERERPGGLVTPDEACLIRDALPRLRETRRTGGDDATLAGAVEAHARAGGGAAYEVDAAALVEWLRPLSSVQLLAVIDLAERMDAAVPGEGCGRLGAAVSVGIAVGQGAPTGPRLSESGTRSLRLCSPPPPALRRRGLNRGAAIPPSRRRR